MKLPSFSHFRNFPAAWLLLFNAITIVVLLPIMEKFVYPWLSKRGYRVIPLTRISIGKFEVGNVPHWSGQGYCSRSTRYSTLFLGAKLDVFL